ncbi:MAG TPA: hypothetical protein VIU87_13655 [Mycobacterium sp.]
MEPYDIRLGYPIPMPTTTIAVPACGIDETRTSVVPSQSLDNVHALVTDMA